MQTGRELIYQSRVYEEHEVYEYGLKELFVWMEEEVKKCVEDLQNGSYNCDVQCNLSARQRTGTISRNDYWELIESNLSPQNNRRNKRKKGILPTIK